LERFSDFMDVFGEEARLETEQVLDGDGDRVVSIFRLTGRGRASGLPHEHRWGYLCRVRDGQIYFMQAFLEPEQALEAAGVRDR
jgi:ketosteroid isomerase-like protein